LKVLEPVLASCDIHTSPAELRTRLCKCHTLAPQLVPSGRRVDIALELLENRLEVSALGRFRFGSRTGRRKSSRGREVRTRIGRPSLVTNIGQKLVGPGLLVERSIRDLEIRKVRLALEEWDSSGAREQDVDAILGHPAPVERAVVIESTIERYDSGTSRQVAMDSRPRPPEKREVLDDQVD